MGLTSSHSSCLSSDAVETRHAPPRVPKRRTTTRYDPPTVDDTSYATEFDEVTTIGEGPINNLDYDERDAVVMFDFSAGIDMRVVGSDVDPLSLVGWEIHVDGEGVGNIVAVNAPSFSGVSFDVQLQDGRRLNVGLQRDDSVTFLQRLY